MFGAAQPRTQGLRAILSILRCRPGTPNPTRVVWFSTREEPIGTLSIYNHTFMLSTNAVQRYLPFMNPLADQSYIVNILL